MRKCILFVLIALLLNSCRYNKTEAIIFGQIDGYFNDTILFYPAQAVFYSKTYGFTPDTSIADENGAFHFRCLSESPLFLIPFTDNGLQLSEAPLLVKPNDSVFLKTSIYNTSNPIFNGANSPFHNFFQEQNRLLDIFSRNRRMYSLPLAKFNSLIDSVKMSIHNKIDSVKDNERISDQEAEILCLNADLFFANRHFDFRRLHIYETTAEWKYLFLDVENDPFPTQLQKEGEQYWFLPNFHFAVDAKLEDDYQRIIHENSKPLPPFETKLSIIENKYSGVVKEVALAQLARRFPEFLNDSIFFETMEKVGSAMKSISFNASLLDFFNQQVGKVSAIKHGYNAPNISLPDKDGKIVSLDSMRGKVVLLIFWGTWCPPCLSSIPKYIQLQNHFQNKSVEFVFIALEARKSDVESWKNFISGKGELAEEFLRGEIFPGTHIVAQKQFQNPEIQHYVITFAPSYVLIDKNCKIAYPRVSLDDELVGKIEQLLEE